MMKTARFLAACFAVMAAVAVSCQSGGDNAGETAAVQVSIAELNANPEEHVGRSVSVSGLVDHVCMHGGMRMFIADDEGKQRLKIETDSIIGPFDVALEGVHVEVSGLFQVLKVDETYLADWEAEARAQHAEQCDEGGHEETGTISHGHGEHEHYSELEDVMNRIDGLRKKLAESGEDYLGYYSVMCKSYTEIEH
jgi:hypothetical protein